MKLSDSYKIKCLSGCGRQSQNDPEEAGGRCKTGVCGRRRKKRMGYRNIYLWSMREAFPPIQRSSLFATNTNIQYLMLPSVKIWQNRSFRTLRLKMLSHSKNKLRKKSASNTQSDNSVIIENTKLVILEEIKPFDSLQCICLAKKWKRSTYVNQR